MSTPHNNRQKKAPLERGFFSADNNQHAKYFATNRRAEKCFSTWQARYAMCGHTLHRTVSADGAISYSSSRWGMVRALKSLDAVAAFFVQIGGKA